MRSDKAAAVAKLAVSDRAVPSWLWPAAVHISSEIRVDREPTTAAPAPAIWPKGSMASAFRLPKGMPTRKERASGKRLMNRAKAGPGPTG